MPKITTRDDADLLDVTQATAPLGPPRPHIIGPVADLNVTRDNPFSGDGSPKFTP